MRSPSSQVLANTANLYIAVSTQADGGFQQSLPAIPTFANVPCSVQYQDTAIVTDAQNRLTTVNTYWVLFGQNYNLSARDTIVWVDDSGVVHTLYTDGLPPSEAGRASAYSIRAVERI